jgi:hypothetical protein
LGERTECKPGCGHLDGSAMGQMRSSEYLESFDSSRFTPGGELIARFAESGLDPLAGTHSFQLGSLFRVDRKSRHIRDTYAQTMPGSPAYCTSVGLDKIIFHRASLSHIENTSIRYSFHGCESTYYHGMGQGAKTLVSSIGLTHRAVLFNHPFL